MCLGLEPGAAGWKAQTNPLSYGGTPGSEPFNSLFQLVLCIGQLNKLCCCYAIGLSN